MKFKFLSIIIFLLLIVQSSKAENNLKNIDNIFHIGKMDSHNKNFAGVILETPFTSMVSVGKSMYPFFPVSILLKDKYESDKKIKNIKSPILIMHGEVDKLVPFWMGKKLYNLANEPKYSYFSKYDDHMMEYNEKLLNELKKFINSLN